MRAEEFLEDFHGRSEATLKRQDPDSTPAGTHHAPGR